MDSCPSGWETLANTNKDTLYTEQCQKHVHNRKEWRSRGVEDYRANDAWIRTLVFPQLSELESLTWVWCPLHERILVGLALRCCWNRSSPEDHWSLMIKQKILSLSTENVVLVHVQRTNLSLIKLGENIFKGLATNLHIQVYICHIVVLLKHLTQKENMSYWQRKWIIFSL